MSRAGVAAGAAVLAAALVFATPQQAQAVECLLDTNDNGVADILDTDGGAIGTGINSLACGLDAEATGTNATAVGSDAQAEGNNSTAVGFGAIALGTNATATGRAALATGDDSSAYGGFSRALADNSIAIGTDSLVFGETPDGSRGGIAVGDSAVVGLDPIAGSETDSMGAIAIGSDLNDNGIGALAVLQGATAVGADSTAAGAGATALGAVTGANGTFATAVGAGATATATGSTALGAFAQADLPAEFVLGVRDNTYTAPGITSRLSESRQFGRLELLTTDRFGHLASDGGQVFEKLADVQAGVALGLAMEAPDLAPAERFALRAGYGNFEGDSHAFGITMIGSLLEDSRRWTWDAGFGAGWSDFNNYESGATWGGRAGVQVAW